MIIADFESTIQGFVHSLSYVAVQFVVNDGWSKNNRRGVDPMYDRVTRVLHGPVTTIVIRDVLLDPSIREMDDVKKKLAGVCFDAAELGQKQIFVMNFKDALEKFLEDVAADGGQWLGHSIDNDIEFLSLTDKRIGAGLFTKDTKAYPSSCCRLKGWKSVTRHCTQQILTRRCPQFWAAYSQAGNVSSKLRDLCLFVGREPQKHTPAQDVMDLCAVLTRAFELDRWKLEEGCSYMISKPVQTSASWLHAKP
jgi:hypothetical protein